VTRTVRGNGKSGRQADPHLSSVLKAFRRILRSLRVAAGETQARYNVSAAQLFILTELNEAGEPLSIRELAERTMTDRSSVADVVDRLVQNGYATRGWSAFDRRRAEIEITNAGARLARSAPPAPTALLVDGLRGLSELELQRLSRGMTRLLDEMGLEEELPEVSVETASRNGVKKRR
jgi:DNA-binding MarR family transcriptional regulator